jgi:hypothetical protein
MRTHEGGCHCGRVRQRIVADLDDALVCNGSMSARAPTGRDSSTGAMNVSRRRRGRYLRGPRLI